MESYIGILNSDTINRQNLKFTVGALEQGMFDCALDGMPHLLNHDFHRVLGWIFPFALHLEPKVTKLLGKFLVCESNEELATIISAVNSHLSKINKEECNGHVEEFKVQLGNKYLNSGKFVALNCVTYKSEGIVNSVYPFLSELKDKDSLIPLDSLLQKFEYLGCGVFKNKSDGFAIYSHQYFRRSLSHLNNLNANFLDAFIKLNAKKDITLRIALDENIIGLSSTYRMRGELDYWWGPKFDDDISAIPDGITRHECNSREKYFSGISGTEFWWKSDEREKTLEIEEIRETPTPGAGSNLYGCRYIHSIYDTIQSDFFHFDGAIRMYDEDKIISRWDVNINKAGKDTIYTKLFRIDGKLSLSDWKNLCILYYYGNPLLYEYFGQKEGYEALLQDETVKEPLQELVPAAIEANEGVRLLVSYHTPNIESTHERTVTNYGVLKSSDNQEEEFIEYEIIELKKILYRLGHNLHIPENVRLVKYRDFYTNFPTIFHSGEDIESFVQTTLKAFKILLSAVREKIDGTISLGISWIMEGKEVKVAVFGKTSEILSWLENNHSIPVTHDSFRLWLDNQNMWLSKTYEYTNRDLSNLIKLDGTLFIKRSPINRDWLKDLTVDSNGVQFELNIPKEEKELQELVASGKIFPSYSMILNEVVCSKTNENYFSTDTIKFIDPDVHVLITKAEMLEFFWTDKEY